MIDKLGREIKVGDFIVYGHAVSRCAGLRIGKVLALKTEQRTRTWGTPYEAHQITVRGIDDDWSHKKLQLCERNGTLLYPARVMVIDPPEQYKELLKNV